MATSGQPEEVIERNCLQRFFGTLDYAQSLTLLADTKWVEGGYLLLNLKMNASDEMLKTGERNSASLDIA